MVTSNKLPDKKVVKMADQNSNAVVPQRTLLGEVNEHITCPLCRGYYIDATTIVECLHSFCRSCIIKHLQVKSYCPVCEMMINSAKPNIKLDKALQDIVYKLVPGLFQKEMERRQQFYASRPGPAASATPEQRGEDTERIIFSPEDVISFSLEYADVTDADSISSKSSDSNEPQPTSSAARRYLQCPAVVNISHLKKFLSMKFDIDSTQFAIDILYKRVPLPDYYTLMDIAYIYNWKRNEPMRFFYQIIDYVAIRNRLFDINRKGSHFRDRKASPTPTEDTNISSPAPNLNDQGSETSSGTDSPMPDDNSVKKISDTLKKADKSGHTLQNNNNTQDLTMNIKNVNNPISPNEKKTDEDVEKSQFLNSFELTAKNNCIPLKSSPAKSNVESNVTNEAATKSQSKEEPLKRKTQIPPNMPEMKKLKIEIEKAKIPDSLSNPAIMGCSTLPCQSTKSAEVPIKPKEVDVQNKTSTVSTINQRQSSAVPPKEVKQQQTPPIVKQQNSDSLGIKRNMAGTHNISSPKRKNSDVPSSVQLSSGSQKTVSPLKLHVPKLEAQSSTSKSADILKPQSVKRIPDLKPTIPISHQTPQNKGQPINKIRMDLLANNSDPTIDRSKILSQVKSSLNLQNTNQTSGDPLKSLFDSCKINIPSSLSITLTDQKLDTRNPNETVNTDQKKNCVSKNTPNTNNTATHKPSPPVHNFIEILKLPDSDTKKPHNKVDGSSDSKQTLPTKNESVSTQQKPTNKSSETSAKGPIPSLKPISDTKLVKQGANFAAPITFQQTFEQQLQSLQSDKKSKLPKNKAQVPKLMPACTSKAFTAACKLNNSGNKTNSTGMTSIENKSSTALDLSTSHNIQSQLGPQQTKAFEKMQSIAKLAKKQNLPSKGLPLALSQNNVFSNVSNRPLNTVPSPLRVPTASGGNQNNIDKDSPTGSQINNVQQELSSKANQLKQTSGASNSVPPPGYQIASHNSPSPIQPSPRSQTRSPSSSPKLVIAEEKQTSSSSVTEQNLNQSNQITSTQLPSINVSKSESPKALPGPSKTGLKQVKPASQTGKITGIRQPITSSMKPNPAMNTTADYLSQPQYSSLSAHHAILRHQMEMHNAWFAMQNVTQRQYDLYKNMSTISHQSQNDFNNKDKQ